MKAEEKQEERATQFVKAYNLARAGGGVRRYHTYRVVCEDTVASHSWGVAVVLDMLYAGQAPAKLLRAALYHDVAEHVFGDIPSPAKRAFNSDELRKQEDKLMVEHSMFTVLSDWERFVLKVADILDGLIYCTEERERGNATLVSVWNTYHGYAKQKLDVEWKEFEHLIDPTEFRLFGERVGYITGIIWARMEVANGQR